MTETEVRDGYGKRAPEYISMFGSMDKTNVQDQRVAHRATSVRGPIIDVGCGPGHWTAYLTDLGVDAQGLDLVPAFIEQAKARFPDTVFRVGSFNDLGVLDGQVRGILPWYSLIHLQDEDLQAALSKLARCYPILTTNPTYKSGAVIWMRRPYRPSPRRSSTSAMRLWNSVAGFVSTKPALA